MTRARALFKNPPPTWKGGGTVVEGETSYTLPGYTRYAPVPHITPYEGLRLKQYTSYANPERNPAGGAIGVVLLAGIGLIGWYLWSNDSLKNPFEHSTPSKPSTPTTPSRPSTPTSPITAVPRPTGKKPSCFNIPDGNTSLSLSAVISGNAVNFTGRLFHKGNIIKSDYNVTNVEIQFWDADKCAQFFSVKTDGNGLFQYSRVIEQNELNGYNCFVMFKGDTIFPWETNDMAVSEVISIPATKASTVGTPSAGVPSSYTPAGILSVFPSANATGVAYRDVYAAFNHIIQLVYTTTNKGTWPFPTQEADPAITLSSFAPYNDGQGGGWIPASVIAPADLYAQYVHSQQLLAGYSPGGVQFS